MPEYAKKTVAELQEILKSRGLASSGKKAELVARLTEADKEAESQATEKVEPAPATAPAPAHAEQLNAPTDEPASGETSQAAEGVAKPADATGDEKDATEAIEAKTYALNLANSDLDAELAKRKARAARFGTAVEANGEAENESAEGETQKNLERAKRFGTGQTAIGKLDEALPNEREHGFGRKRKGGPVPEGGSLDDPGLRRGFRPGGRGGFRGRRRGGGGDRPTGVSKPATAYTNDKDREAAEARKKRFAAA